MISVPHLTERSRSVQVSILSWLNVAYIVLFLSIIRNKRQNDAMHLVEQIDNIVIKKS